MSAQKRRAKSSGLRLRDYAIPALMVAIMLVMGVIFGSVGAQTLDPTEKARLVEFLGKFSQSLVDATPGAEISPQAAIITNLQKLGIIWILAATVIGAPAILVIMFLQGFAVGFTMAVLISEWSLGGLLLGLASVIPHNIFLSAGLAVSSAAGLLHAWDSAKSLFAKDAAIVGRRLVSFSVICLLCAVVLIVAGLVEAYISPLLVRTIAPLVL